MITIIIVMIMDIMMDFMMVIGGDIMMGRVITKMGVTTTAIQQMTKLNEEIIALIVQKRKVR